MIQNIKNSMSTKAINKALKLGGKFRFNIGTYNLTEPLVLYSNTTVTCDDGVIFNRKHSGRMIETSCSNKTKAYNGANNISWCGGTFNADKHTGNANVITLFHASGIILSKITINGCVGLHSIEINACKNVAISECKISNQSSRPGEEFREGIQIDYANYDGLKWHDAGSDAKCYDGTHCDEIIVIDNEINSCPAGIGTHTVSNDKKYHTNVLIKNNKISGCKVDVRLCGFSDSRVINQNVKAVVKDEAHKYHGGKIKLKNLKGNTNIVFENCEVNIV